MENFGEISSNPQLIRLDELSSKRELLEAQIQRDDFADPSIKGAYVEAHANLGTEIVTITEDDSVRGELEAIRETAEKGIEQIEELKELTGAEDDPKLREEFESRIRKVSSYIGEKSVGSAVKEPSAPAEREAGASGTNEQVKKTALKLTVSNQEIEIGEDGERVPFDKRTSPDQTSYATERKTALVYIISRQGKETKQDDVWQAIKEATQHTDEEFGKVMKNVRSWLVNLRHERIPLIDHNGQRGSGASFTTLEQFEFEMEVEERKEEEPEQLAELPEHERIISTKDIALVAHKLSLINGALEDYGFPPMDRELLSELTHLANITPIPEETVEEDIEKRREQAFERLQDMDLLAQYIDIADGDSPQFRFVDYLLELEDVGSSELIRKLITSRIESKHVIERGVGYDDGGTTLLDSETGEKLWPRETGDEGVLFKPVAEGATATSNGDEPEPEPAPEPAEDGEVPSGLSKLIPGRVVDAVGEGARRLRHSGREGRVKERMEPLTKEIEEITTRFFESFDDPQEQIQVAALAQAFGQGIRPKLIDYDRAHKIRYNGQNSDEKHKMDLRKLIKVKLYGERKKDRNFLDNHEGEIDEAIDTAVKKILAAT